MVDGKGLMTERNSCKTNTFNGAAVLRSSNVRYFRIIGMYGMYGMWALSPKSGETGRVHTENHIT